MKHDLRAERKLKDREEQFCVEYARCLSIPDAARSVGLSESAGHAWVRDPAIKWRIRELVKERAAEAHVEVGNVLREMLHLAHFDPADLFDDQDQLIPLKQMPLFARKAIKEITYEQKYIGEDPSGLPISKRITHVKLHSKEKALEMLARFKKLFGEDEPEKRRVSVVINAGGERKTA